MARHRVTLTHRQLRSILTDMLPFEVPPTFSNRGFYRFLRNNGIEIVDDRIIWIADTDKLDMLIKLLFGCSPTESVLLELKKEWGKEKKIRYLPLNSRKMETIPFHFRVSHKLDGRLLSVVHPRNQLAVANFYANYNALIIFYSSISDFSIRRPVAVARYVFFKDTLHQENLDPIAAGIEEEEHEYEQLGSYFVYKKYRNVHKFFESYKYHRCEKKYNAMVQLDVSKCFDSIYTHSLSWAILGKGQTKHSLQQSISTFAGRFDKLMQQLNHNETNGIVIGPEFSRIFAELILQSVDAELQTRLWKISKLSHKIDYEVFRYVDDYFIFYNDASTQLLVFEALQDILRTKKLSINTAKIKLYEKPIITEITIAKSKVTSLLNKELDFTCNEIAPLDADSQPVKTLMCDINCNRLIILYKSTLKDVGVSYDDILNYTFAIIEGKIGKLCKLFSQSTKNGPDCKRFIKALVAIVEFSFFTYSASPKVNHTIRLCRIISTSVTFLHAQKFSAELKHFLFKFVHENVVQQIEKNAMTAHREIENLYLLISLSLVGKSYWLPEVTLLKYFGIDTDDVSGEYKRNDSMNHFQITICLSYMQNKVRYNKLRTFIEKHALEKLSFSSKNCRNDAECCILFLDLIVCPYITDTTKKAIGLIFEFTPAAVASLQSINNHWFTAWDKKFRLGKELDAKQSREVY